MPASFLRAHVPQSAIERCDKFSEVKASGHWNPLYTGSRRSVPRAVKSLCLGNTPNFYSMRLCKDIVHQNNLFEQSREKQIKIVMNGTISLHNFRMIRRMVFLIELYAGEKSPFKTPRVSIILFLSEKRGVSRMWVHDAFQTMFL